MCVHLRVEEAHRSLNHANGLIVDLLGDNLALGALENRRDAQGKVLGVHLRRKRIGQALALASRDGHAIARGGEIAEDDRWVGSAGDILRRQERAADDEDINWLRLGVVDVEDCAGWVAVHELDAEDLGVGE